MWEGLVRPGYEGHTGLQRYMMTVFIDTHQGYWLILHAEIYPSLVAVEPSGEVKDRAQVRTVAAHFAGLDDAEQLSELFAGRNSLTPLERQRIEQEEGWTLGVGASHAVRRPIVESLPAITAKVTSWLLHRHQSRRGLLQ